MTPLVPTARRAPSRRLPVAAASALASSATLILLASAPAHAAASLTTFEGQDAASLAESLMGAHVSLTSATLSSGRDVQAASFAELDLGLPTGPVSGVALSTGSLRAADPEAAADVDFTASALLGPNAGLTTTGDLGGGGSALLESSFGRTTYDAAELRLDLVPNGNSLTIVYQIGSEEYAGWAARDYTDAFGVYVDGRLCSTIGDLPVGVETVNADTRSELFVSNVTAEGAPGDRATEMNGYTVALTCTAAVTPGQPVTVVAAVADTRDGQLDSTLLLAAGGITSVPGPAQPTTPPTGEDGGASASPNPVPASDTSSTGAGSTRPSSPLANTGVDGSAVAAGAGIAAAAMGAGVAALLVARRRRARDGVSAQ